MRLARPVTGRWALLAGLLAAGALTLVAPSRYPDWVNASMCVAGGCVAAWAVLWVAGRRKP